MSTSWVHPALRISLSQRVMLEELLAKKMDELASSDEEYSFMGQQVRFTALDGFLVRSGTRMGITWYHTYDFAPLLEKMRTLETRKDQDSTVWNQNYLPAGGALSTRREPDSRFVWVAVTAPLLRFLDDNDYDLFATYLFETIKGALKKRRLPTMADFRYAEREAFEKMSKIPPIFRKGEPLQPSAIFHRHVIDKILLLHRIGLPIEKPVPLSGTFVLEQFLLRQKLERALHLAQTKLGSWADESRRIFRVRVSNNLFRTSNYRNTIIPTTTISGKKLNVIVVSSIFAEQLTVEDLERLIFVEMVEMLTKKKYERAVTLSESISDILMETVQRNVHDKIHSVYSEEEINATRNSILAITRSAVEERYQSLSVVPISQLS